MSYKAVNLALEIVCILILVVLIVCQLAVADRRSKVNRAFLAVLYQMTLMHLFDTFAWGFNKMPGALMPWVTRFSNLMVYLLGPLVCLSFFAYISESIPLDSRVRRVSRGFLLADLSVYLLIVLLTQFNGMVYWVDGDNRFHWGGSQWTLTVLLLLYYIVLIFVIMRSRHKLTLGDLLTYLSYPLIPFVAALFNLVYYKLMLAPVAMTLSLLIIFVNIQMQREKRMKEQELALQNQQVSMMLSQIQPHFLYNSLTAITDLYDGNPEARQAVLTFSRYLRANMDSLAQKQPVPFEDELEHTRQYLWLEKLRFEERLQVVYEIAADNFTLPALTLQPLAENAVQHGLTRKASGGTLTIRTVETPAAYQVVVIDDGVGFDPAAPAPQGRSHTGIANVRTRLAAMCGGTLDIQSSPGSGTTATITLPKQEITS